jgi:hypothetical protein
MLIETFKLDDGICRQRNAATVAKEEWSIERRHHIRAKTNDYICFTFQLIMPII